MNESGLKSGFIHYVARFALVPPRPPLYARGILDKTRLDYNIIFGDKNEVRSFTDIYQEARDRRTGAALRGERQ